MLDWLGEHKTLLTWLMASGAIVFLVSLVAVPLWVARLPEDYFAHAKRPPSALAKYPPLVRLPLRVGKNLLGVVLMLAGLAMLVLPGQGIATAVIGFLLVEVPGKYRFEKWLISRPRVLRGVNWLRRKASRGPLRSDRKDGPRA